jgi:hypothetical protein
MKAAWEMIAEEQYPLERWKFITRNVRVREPQEPMAESTPSTIVEALLCVLTGGLYAWTKIPWGR